MLLTNSDDMTDFGRVDALRSASPVRRDRVAAPGARPAESDFRSAGRGRSERHDAHDMIFREDDAATSVYELASGQVMLYRLLADGRRQVVDILGAGDLFGLSPNGHHDCSAEALTPVSLRAVDRREIDQSPALLGQVNRSLLQRIEALHSHAVLLGRQSASERVASFLMRFVPGRGISGCAGPEGDGGDSAVVVLKMTRQEIADYLGLTIETVSRVLSDLRRRGLITLERNDRVLIGDVCKICKITGIH